MEEQNSSGWWGKMPDHDKERQEVGVPWTVPINVVCDTQIWVDIIYTVELFDIFLATLKRVLSSFVFRITTVFEVKTCCYCFFYTGNGLPLDF